MPVRDDIIALALNFAGKKHQDTEDTDFLGAFDLAGDSATEFLTAFGDAFDVDMSGLVWYFHFDADEPPGEIQRVRAVDTHGRKIPLEPITLSDLSKAVTAGKWDKTYPIHTVGQSLWARFQLTFIALILLGLFLLFGLGVLT